MSLHCFTTDSPSLGLQAIQGLHSISKQLSIRLRSCSACFVFTHDFLSELAVFLVALDPLELVPAADATWPRPAGTTSTPKPHVPSGPTGAKPCQLGRVGGAASQLAAAHRRRASDRGRLHSSTWEDNLALDV